MRRIAVFTSTRADYGLLTPVLHAIDAADDLELQLVVSGTHLSDAHGHTVDAVVTDGFVPAAAVDLELGDTSPAGLAAAAGRCTAGVGAALERLLPDLFVLLGDRYETLAAAVAATLVGVPIVHLHGGELTQGAIDDAQRHALTKLSHVHLVAAKEFATRVRQLGEPPEHVHVVGSPGLDLVASTAIPTRAQLEAELGLELASPFFLVTHHPATASSDDPVGEVEALVEALATVPDATVLVTGTNADPGSDVVTQVLDAFVADGPRRHHVVSLGSRRYFAAVQAADVVVGNSSSGLIEVPFLGTPTVDIGQRQAGRLRGPSVVHAEPTASSIAAAIARAMSEPVRAAADTRTSPYGDGAATDRIIRALRNVELEGLRSKRFADIAPPGGRS